MSKTSKAILGIALAGILGGGGAYIGFSTVENNKLKNDYTKLNNQYEIIKKGYDEQQKLIVSKDTTIEDLKRQLEALNQDEVEIQFDSESEIIKFVDGKIIEIVGPIDPEGAQ